MTEAPRIRWQETEAGIFAGYVGTVVPALFSIWQPPQHGGMWALTSDLLGMEAERLFRFDAEELKPEAERMLSQFASSLGAPFPAEGTESSGER